MAIQDYIKQAVDFLNSPENLAMAEAAQTMQQVTLPDGRTLNVYPDGTAQEFTSDNRVKVYNQSGDVILNQTQEEYARPGYLTPVVNALMAAAGGAVLGPAGAGLLSTPAAAAAGAGGTTLARGGDVESALKAAALAGLTAYGAQGLLGGGETAGAQQALELSLADDISQLAQQGLSQNQIANIISQGYGVDPFAAAEAVTSALSSVAPSAATQTVNVSGTGLLNPAIVPSAVGSLASMAGTGGVTQQVEVPGSRATTTENIISSLVPALTTAAVPTTPAVTQPTGTQQVEVSTTRDKSLLPTITPPVIAAIPALPAGLTAELPKPVEPTQKTGEQSLFKPSDLLKVIGLLGGAGAGAALSGAGTTGVGSVPPSDTMLGTTTPQFGPDYYAAVQRYYNAYMPETPRNVAGPLQQWYENKFGA